MRQRALQLLIYRCRYVNTANRSPEVGAAFTSGGALFLLLGVFFFFDRALLAMGNILLLIGVTALIGPSKTLLFFADRRKWKGTAAFAAGIILILMRWALIGFCVELYGIFILFGGFIGTFAGVLKNIPVVGPYIGMITDRIPGGRDESLPV